MKDQHAIELRARTLADVGASISGVLGPLDDRAATVVHECLTEHPPVDISSNPKTQYAQARAIAGYAVLLMEAAQAKLDEAPAEPESPHVDDMFDEIEQIAASLMASARVFTDSIMKGINDLNK